MAMRQNQWRRKHTESESAQNTDAKRRRNKWTYVTARCGKY